MKTIFKNARTLGSTEPVHLRAETGRWTAEEFSEREADRVVDLEGGFVLPGFVDCHCHILPMGLDLQSLDLSDCWTKEDVLSKIAAVAAQSDGWLFAVQYDQTRFADGSHLTTRELDPVTKGIPTILRHSSGHAAVVNSAALEAAGIGVSTEDPAGGTIVRDKNGAPIGPLLENAMGLVYRVAPRPSVGQMRDAILAAQRRLRSLGITCATDMATGSRGLEEEMAAYDAAAQQRICRSRLTLLWERVFGNRASPPPELSAEPEWLSVLGVKLFADGAIGAGTAAMNDEYKTGGLGMLIHEPEDLRERVRVADTAGFRIAIHSIGDRSTAVVLDALEATPTPSRHRIEHAMALDEALLARMQRLGVGVAAQPEFLLRFGHAYQRQLRDDKASQLKPLRSLLRAGIPLGLSSDLPIVPGDPWDGIRVAVSRPDGFDPKENLTIEEAVLCYTRSAARLNGDEDQGEIKSGCWADFQVYDGNPLSDSEARLIATYVAADES